MMKGIPKTT